MKITADLITAMKAATTVPSFTRPGVTFTVTDAFTENATCSCEHFLFTLSRQRGFQACKHIQFARRTIALIESNAREIAKAAG